MNESENLAERLRSLYQMYDCEDELPVHADLVRKLEEADPEISRYVQLELDRGIVYPLSLDEALKHTTFSQSVKEFYAIVFLTLPILGPKVIPTAFREAFLRTGEEKARELMKGYNYDAKKNFEQFKQEVRYDFDEEFRNEVDSGLYKPNQE